MVVEGREVGGDMTKLTHKIVVKQGPIPYRITDPNGPARAGCCNCGQVAKEEIASNDRRFDRWAKNHRCRKQRSAKTPRKETRAAKKEA